MTTLPASTADNQENKMFHFPELRVVEASAGSGKTYALAKRYVQLLLSAPDPAAQAVLRGILAITFTNKAATEMKERILEFLKTIALKKLSVSAEADILLPLGVTPEEAGPKAFAMMEAVIRRYNFFQVQTIDKFINALLCGCAFKVGLTAHFKIKTNAREYLEYGLDQLIDRASRDQDLRQVFEYFLHNYLYLENRSGWFPKKDMAAILYALFTHSNTYGGNLREGSFTPEDVIRRKKTVLEDMNHLRGCLPEDADRRFVKSLDEFLGKNTRLFDIDAVSTYFAREELPARKNAVIPTEISRLWTKIHGNLRDICREEAYGLFNPYIRVFGLLQSVIEELAAKDDVLFLEELNKKAGRLFDEDDVTVAELYYRLAGRFRHYLIDEFQDTSRLQWHNLEKMAEEALSTGGSLFYVGDRKQAIYGFRGGEAALFDDVHSRFDAFPVRVEYLTKNWRSQKAIVDFNNTVFSHENLRNFVAQKEEYERGKKKGNIVEFSPDDYAALDHLFQGSRQSGRKDQEGGYVRVEAISPKGSLSAIDPKEERDELIRARVTGFIRELRGRFAYRDIAVLTRNNAQVGQMTHRLLQEGIPVSSERTSDITGNRIVQEVIVFLRFLDSPIDNLAFSAFVLGDILPTAAGISRETAHAFIFDLRERLDHEKDFYVYMEFRGRFQEVWQEYFDEFFRHVGLYPLYELVVSIYNRFGLLARFPEDQGFLMHLLELVKKQEEEHSDITSFLEYFENLAGEDVYVHAPGSDAVQILTVHKAKGLEFPVVILPYLGMDVQVGTTGDDYVPSYILRQEDSALKLLRLKSKYYSFSDELYAIYAREYKKAFRTELNNMYVALTRAQDELYVFLPPKVGNSFNLAQMLIPEDIRETGAPGKARRRMSGEGVVLDLPASQYHDWIHYLKDEFLPAGEAGAAHNRLQRLRGEVVHFMLSFIGNLDHVDPQECLANALAQARMNFPFVKDTAVYASLLEELFKEPKAKPFFYCGQAQVFTEKEIVNAQGHIKRLDRLMIGEREVWIVDFKFAREGRGEYVQQIREYMAAAGGMYPQKKIKGYLVYLDKMDVEEVM